MVWHPHVEYLPTRWLCSPLLLAVGCWYPAGGVVYLSWSVGVSCRIWSHTCNSWYLPKFLFKEESFPLINMASLMFHSLPCASIWTILKQSGLIGCLVELLCWQMVDGALRCSLSLSTNALPVCPMYSSGQLICGHLNFITPLFCSLVALSLGAVSSVLIVFEPYSVLVYPTCCMSFWTSHPIPVYMEPLWKGSCYCCRSHCCCGCCVDCLLNWIHCCCSACTQNYGGVCWVPM